MSRSPVTKAGTPSSPTSNNPPLSSSSSRLSKRPPGSPKKSESYWKRLSFVIRFVLLAAIAITVSIAGDSLHHTFFCN